jgi:hypothetical protein
MSFVLWIFICGCGARAPSMTGAASGHDVSAKADGVDDESPVTFTLLQAGALAAVWDGDQVPDLVHYGVMAEPGLDWQDVADAAISYGVDQESQAVAVTVTGVSQRPILGFALHTKTHSGEDVWTDNQYVDLRHPEGTLVRLPLADAAPYPFQCYEVSIDNEGSGPITSYQGRVTDIYYGFTLADTKGYEANNDVAWLDLFDRPMAVGDITPVIRHDGDYKGSMRLLPVFIRVPQDRNLVFKLGIDKLSGGCTPWNGPQGAIEHAETQTYFLPAS